MWFVLGLARWHIRVGGTNSLSDKVQNQLREQWDPGRRRSRSSEKGQVGGYVLGFLQQWATCTDSQHCTDLLSNDCQCLASSCNPYDSILSTARTDLKRKEGGRGHSQLLKLPKGCLLVLGAVGREWGRRGEALGPHSSPHMAAACKERLLLEWSE